MSGWSRGRLAPSADAPEKGERIDRVLDAEGLVIEQILSSASVEPVTYDQDHDEWVVVTNGSATLDIEGEEVELEAGEWLFLPARTRHRVVRTEAGTTWLAVHLPEPGS